jgi:stage V sporulation protein D (sporulation-specific penicillin-binding protein)
MWRITTAFVFYVCLFSLIIIRLFYWQIISGDDLRLAAMEQYSLEFTLPASRGDILVEDGSPLAMNSVAHLVFAQPKEITSFDEFAGKVAPILTLDKNDLVSELSVPGRIWVPISHKVDSDKVDQLKALGLKGIGFEREPKRYYPEASMAAQLLGFVGLDQNGRDKGYFGLEGYYDRELRGKDGRLEVEKDVRGSPIVIGDAKRIEAENGRSLVLWVDRTIQRIAEEKLLEGMTKYGAKEGTVSIMDPKTGGILALASYPSYDPLRYGLFDKNTYQNPIVASTYEPGSTFKVLVMASALNERAVTAQTTMEETGPVDVGEYTIKTWNNQYAGTQTMTEVIQHSSNVGMVFVARKLGKEKLISYIRNFGFGQLTGIDLEEEASPLMREDKEWRDIDLATASFGQGIAVTPLQMIRAVGALANDGWLMEPRMVKEIRGSDGKTVVIKPKKIRQVVGADAAHVVTEMMINAVDNGEAKWAKPKGYRIAGKTGTAQIPVAGHYDETKTIASFVGFAPADNPRFVMLVTLREPSSSPWGSETAAPLFFTIAKELFLYLGIPPQ